uniref:Uncharacterized protein n=1 Tax=Capra hircus TaxID=9925 RepID=A0A452FHX2_CAPHI
MKNGGKKTLDLCLVPHFRCKDSYPIDNISFHFCAILCMNSGTRRLCCEIINLYCYLKNDNFHN